jgi:hypothetical protein
MPVAMFVSAMPAPDIPEAERPWRRQALLDDAGFKVRGRQNKRAAIGAPSTHASPSPLQRLAGDADDTSEAGWMPWHA